MLHVVIVSEECDPNGQSGRNEEDKRMCYESDNILSHIASHIGTDCVECGEEKEKLEEGRARHTRIDM
jgi:hypothetical protein